MLKYLLLGCVCFVTIYSQPNDAQSTIAPNTAAPLTTKVNINKVMAYPMEKQIKRYMKDYKDNLESARLCEKEFKRWLIVSEELGEGLDMFSEDVDNFWHTCILYTREYAQFCNDCFGRFIHHTPKE